MTKICGRCQAEKQISEFKERLSCPDGRDYLCFPCRKSKDNEYHKTPSGQAAARRAQLKYNKTEKGIISGKKKSFKARRGNGRYNYAKYKALYRGYIWGIPKEVYAALISLPCEYCGVTLPTSGICLDRIENSKGYEEENVLPCCPICNYARRNQFTVEEMKTFIGPAIRKVRESRQEVTMT